MSGIIFQVHSEALEQRLKDMADRINNKTLLQKAGAIVRESVRTNFAAGGRPNKWAPLKTRAGQPLRDRGILQNSITSKVSGDRVYVGTSVKYAAVHQFGARKGSFGTVLARVRSHERTRDGKTHTVRAHARKQLVPWGDIPARPFLLVQDEDRVELEAVLADYIFKGER